MTPKTSDVVVSAPAAASRRTAGQMRGQVHAFYVAMAILLTGIVLWGFWPSYYGHLARGVMVERHWIMHLHGAVFTGWLVLLLAQVGLAAAGRVRLHRRLGNVGIAYGALVLVMGLIASVLAPVLHVRAGEWTVDAAAAFAIVPLGDMLLFAGFFGSAVAYRRRPEIHKRLILAATVALAFAAVARIFEPAIVPILVVWLSPMAAAMAFDVYLRGRVHPVNVISVAALLVVFTRLLIMESPAWLRIGRALLAPFL